MAGELFSEFVFVSGDTAESLLDGIDGLDRVGEGHTEVTKDGRVREITLESRDRELGSEVSEKGNR